jgi:hypothetical protein
METWRHGDGGMVTWGHGTWRHGDGDMEHGDMVMETWRWRHGNREIWKHGDFETRKHGDTETWRHSGMDMDTKRNLKLRRFSLVRLPFAHRANGSL